ncbi:hypothetical protein [Halococcus saccharolyticus]|uniref:Uncharacterized protein n=1 Tax=Halococcus saccharolyticus DSM 5350 TaxID=1227455 RepID=M0MC28_9EURY|nr:hypothetical protein [Halococcus saccharolyticus]EMA43327.1 hypothetical protein C449_15152 [Halococcus saccharolyticus DSM 5350]
MTGERDVDPAPLAVGALVGLAGLLFLLEPVVDPIPVLGTPTPPFVLSGAVLTIGFGLGAAVYLRRGRRLIGLAHAVGAGGFGLLVGATALGSGTVLVAGVAVLAGGCAFLVSQVSR